MTTISEIDEQMKELKLKKKNILNDKDKQTPTKQNDDLWSSIKDWNRACKDNVKSAKEEGRKGWLY